MLHLGLTDLKKKRKQHQRVWELKMNLLLPQALRTNHLDSTLTRQ
jgi:hypothetical protein